MKRTLFFFILTCVSVAHGDCRDLAAPRAVESPVADQWTLGSLNLWRLRDTVRDSKLDDPISSALLERRLEAIADTVVQSLKAPHLLAVQEVENRELLEALVVRLAKRGWYYRAVLLEGNDPSGMDVGLLYRRPIQVGSVEGLFADDAFQEHALYSRPPLRVSLTAPVSAQLVVVHLRSARDLQAPRVLEKRAKQAERLAMWVQSQTEPVIVAGDFNSSWGTGAFSDSYHRFASAGLFNLWEWIPSAERYSYRYRCRPQAIDHIWISPGLKQRVQRVSVSRGHAGRYRALYGSDGVSPVSDHDALVVYFETEQ
ncbi:hypothetical protein Y5S_00734 [Alcanivorax nanhaiticus]|uniref:Endonuclease/exonuclease/phosphatase domain-containing protein n=1 Tax=Alcanivorax nanhaiticus TaxID=1177154 RepID=A0A095SNV6_9GAMM|nr:endonuclease/exonuclease/phosphatase family protein [Alcanivorax nanhaiticus]KGD66262.1 hypothetical protein Y5S_00734 [Alcanivorax nanhaiticus]